MRLPFLFAGFVLGACIWWVTRRLYGNFGGYTALALYCFSPAMLKACVAPQPEILAALLGLAAMLWVAEGHRSQTLPVVLAAALGALVLLFACYSFSPDAFSYLFRSSAAFLNFSIDPARRFFATLANGGITVASCAALLLYLAARPSRYFGNTAPFLCALILILLVMTGAPGSPWLWSLPFLLTFIGGVFADAYDSPRGRLALAAAGTLVLAQAVLCILSLPSLA